MLFNSIFINNLSLTVKLIEVSAFQHAVQQSAPLADLAMAAPETPTGGCTRDPTAGSCRITDAQRFNGTRLQTRHTLSRKQYYLAATLRHCEVLSIYLIQPHIKYEKVRYHVSQNLHHFLNLQKVLSFNRRLRRTQYLEYRRQPSQVRSLTTQRQHT